jgi:hypothetical protein
MRSISDLENTSSATDNHEFDDAPSDVSDNLDEPAMDIGNAPVDSSAFVTFNCSTAGCVKQYRRFGNLIKHHARGDHVFKPDKVTLRDRAILMYKDRAESVKPNQIHELNHFNLVSSTSMSSDDDDDDANDERKEQVDTTLNQEEQGWALSESKSAIRYSPDQIRYLTQKYDEGEASGHKWNPATVACVSDTEMCEPSTLASHF